MNMVAVVACVLAVSAVPAYAHTVDSAGEYRLEVQWEVEPPYSGEVNAIKLFVSPLVPGMELEEQPFRNGVAGLEDTLKLQLVARDYIITLLPEADDQTPGLYRTYVKVLRPGFYQLNILGQIEDTSVSLSMHPSEIRNVEHITFPDDYGAMHDVLMEQESIRMEMEQAASEGALIQDLEVRLDMLAGDLGVLWVPGVADIILGGIAVYMARQRRG